MKRGASCFHSDLTLKNFTVVYGIVHCIELGHIMNLSSADVWKAFSRHLPTFYFFFERRGLYGGGCDEVP